MASNVCKALYLFLWATVDVSVMTALYPQQFENYWARFVSDVLHFSMSHTMFDLWLCSLIRSSMIVGALIGFLRNTTDGANRTRRARLAVLLLSVFMWDYPIVKLLIYSEHVAQLNSIYFWVTFAWSLLASVVFCLNWILLGTFKSLNRRQPLTINDSNSEREPLLSSHRQSNNKDDKESQKDGKFKMSMIRRLLSYSKPDWFLLLIAFVFLTLSSLAGIFTPWYTGQVIEGIAITKDKAKFTRAIIIMALFSAGSALAAGVRGGCFALCIARLNMRLRKSLFSSLVNQEIGFFDVTQTGEITSRITSDTTIMSDTLALNVNICLRSLITAVGICVFMFKLSWQLSMVTVLGLPISFVVSKVYGRYLQKLTKKIQDYQAKANHVAEEVVSSMRTVRSFAGEHTEVDRYSERLLDTYRMQKRSAAAYAGYVWCSEIFSLFLVVATLYYGGHLVISSRLSGGQLVSFILYQLQLGYAFDSMAYVYSGLMQAAGASEKVFEFISRKPTIPTGGGLKPTSLKGKIEFNNVTFAYPSRPDATVLKNVSFEVQPGEIVALVGPSGGGKSSCVSLLEHFYETKSGEVLLDGVPIQQYDHGFLHEKIALVGQEPVLYARSIKENIAYGLEKWDMAMVQQAAKMANAHDFIMGLKDKYETEAGEKGNQLSGGQKQRIAIARAVIRNPTILLLDEATSALDAESEHVVQQAIYKNLSGHTVLIIAHRLSTVECANRIVVINQGQIVEQGTHGDLLKRGGLYTKLVQRQLLGVEAGLSECCDELCSDAVRRSSAERRPSGQLVAKEASPPENCSSFKFITESPQLGSLEEYHSLQQHGDISFEIGTPKFGSLSNGSFQGSSESV